MPNERKDSIVSLLKLGRLSPAQIAAQVGVSRNVVIGIKHRLGASIQRHVTHKGEGKLKQRPLQTASPWKTCQYIKGDPRHHKMCGKPTKRGFSYCEAHCSICYLPRAVAQAMPV